MFLNICNIRDICFNTRVSAAFQLSIQVYSYLSSLLSFMNSTTNIWRFKGFVAWRDILGTWKFITTSGTCFVLPSQRRPFPFQNKGHLGSRYVVVEPSILETYSTSRIESFRRIGMKILTALKKNWNHHLDIQHGTSKTLTDFHLTFSFGSFIVWNFHNSGQMCVFWFPVCLLFGVFLN